MQNFLEETLRKVIDIFFEHYDTSEVRVIMVDKDLTEISALKDKNKNPPANVQICSFRVLKYFKSKAKLNLKQDDKSELIQLLHKILYSQERYEENRNRLAWPAVVQLLVFIYSEYSSLFIIVINLIFMFSL